MPCCNKKIVNIPKYIGYRKGHAGCEKKENIVIKNERCDIFVISWHMTYEITHTSEKLIWDYKNDKLI